MPWIWAALMPHPPVIVPEVGRGREENARMTLEGAGRLRALISEECEKALPDVLLVLSPHHPHTPGSLFLNTATRIRGNLSRFGAPGSSVALETPAGPLAELKTLLRAEGIPAAYGDMEDIMPDHGTTVPLLGIASCFPGGALPPVIIANPSGLSPEQASALGGALHKLPSTYRWALLASGDLSHRLKADGPYGFNPDGPVFDAAVVEALKAGNPGPLTVLTEKIRDNAGECGMRPVLALLGLTQGPVQVLSYEGPFGVGYCNAFWAPGKQRSVIRVSVKRGGATPSAAAPANPPCPPYPALARKTIAAHLSGASLPGSADVAALSTDASLWNVRHGCFVSIKNKDGSLRGCIGTFMPTRESLDAEIMANAVSAAVRDPRFPPMRPEELDNVRISVDVLSHPEQVTEGMTLDPARYGVIVAKGGRRGLLLPDLEGVDSVEKQLAIAASKAGINDLTGADIYRFTVRRYREQDGPEAAQ